MVKNTFFQNNSLSHRQTAVKTAITVNCLQVKPNLRVQIQFEGDIVSSNVVNPFNSLSFTCPSGETYTAQVNFTDGTHNFSIKQTASVNGLDEVIVIALEAQVDTTAPSVITIDQGTSFTSGENTTTITGTCESGASLSTGGAESLSASCTSGMLARPRCAGGNLSCNLHSRRQFRNYFDHWYLPGFT